MLTQPVNLQEPHTTIPTSPTLNIIGSDISETSDTVPSSVNELLHQVNTSKTEISTIKDQMPNLVSNKTNDTITPSFDKLTEKNLLLNNGYNYFASKHSKSDDTNPEHENTDSSQQNDLEHHDAVEPHMVLSNNSVPSRHVAYAEEHLYQRHNHFNSSHEPDLKPTFPNNVRRHTSPHAIYHPNKQSTESRVRNSIDDSHVSPSLSKSNRTLIPRSTFPFTQNKPDIIEDQLNKSRSTKRKKMKWLEDDSVAVGNKISEGHQNFVMAYNMLTGIRVAVSRCSGVMTKITEKDFKSTKKLSFNMDGSELTPSSKYDFKFKDYCPEVFRDLRSSFGIDPADYLVSITGKYILSELGSPGKSGSFFYYSRDYRFIIKTIRRSEHKQLRAILKDYYDHVKENPNTLISQFYGLHRVKMPFKNGNRKVYFVVMNNLFPPHRDIHLKYDLKGSTWGRITRIDAKTDLSQVTLKDLNWLERHEQINLGPSKRKQFLEQLEKDVALLKRINVMDYSLLLGVHDVKRGNTDELKLSVFDPKSSNKSELIRTNPRDIDREIDLPNQVYPGRTKFIFYGHDGGIRATNENNEPLSQIYYLGIIDCLTKYSCKKRLETAWRSFRHPRETISAVPAKEYGDRFLRFVAAGTSNFKQKVQ